MRQAGEVTFADAHKLRQGEGVVEFASMSDMKRALEKLDGTELNGRKLKISEERGRGVGARGFSRRSRSRSRSESRSPSRSRSRSSDRSSRSSTPPKKAQNLDDD